MLRSMFAAISGLKVHQTMLDVTSNDIANVNTVGYKSGRTTFKDSLSQMQRGATAPGAGQGGANPAQVGLGVQLGSIDNNMSSGSLQSTGNPLDVSIQGEGWFRVGVPGAPGAVPTQVEYTRAGNFTRNQQGYLVNQDGYYVIAKDDMGADQVVQIPPTASNVSIGQDGTVSYTDVAPAPVRRLSLAKFPNESGLERASNNRWRETPNSGAAQVGTPGNGPAGNFGLTVSGTIEMSNVDLASQFTNMITAQRGFQANSRIISVGDELLQDLVNLKR